MDPKHGLYEYGVLHNWKLFKADTAIKRDPYDQCFGSGSVSFWSPRPGSSQKYGSGSFHHQAKIVRKYLNSNVVWLLYNFLSFLSLKNYINVPSKSNKQKTFKKESRWTRNWKQPEGEHHAENFRFSNRYIVQMVLKIINGDFVWQWIQPGKSCMMWICWETFFSVVERGRRKRYFVEGEFPFDGQLRGFCRLLLILHNQNSSNILFKKG